MNKISRETIEAKIVDVQYDQPTDTTLTICRIKMGNGFIAIGESACVEAENFNADIGKKYAYENAFAKLWALEGYLLKSIMAGDLKDQQVGWVIEHKSSETDRPFYFAGIGELQNMPLWSHDFTAALKFATQADAAKIAWSNQHRVCQHTWCDN